MRKQKLSYFRHIMRGENESLEKSTMGEKELREEEEDDDHNQEPYLCWPPLPRVSAIVNIITSLCNYTHPNLTVKRHQHLSMNMSKRCLNEHISIVTELHYSPVGHIL